MQRKKVTLQGSYHIDTKIKTFFFSLTVFEGNSQSFPRILWDLRPFVLNKTYLTQTQTVFSVKTVHAKTFYN